MGALNLHDKFLGYREDGETGAIIFFCKIARCPNTRFRLALARIWGTSALLCLDLVPSSEKVRCSRPSPGFEVPQGKSR